MTPPSLETQKQRVNEFITSFPPLSPNVQRTLLLKLTEELHGRGEILYDEWQESIDYFIDERYVKAPQNIIPQYPLTREEFAELSQWLKTAKDFLFSEEMQPIARRYFLTHLLFQLRKAVRTTDFEDDFDELENILEIVLLNIPVVF